MNSPLSHALLAASILAAPLAGTAQSTVQSPVPPATQSASLTASTLLPDSPLPRQSTPSQAPSQQSQQQQTTTPQPPPQTPAQTHESAADLKAAEKQRIAGVVPDFSVVMNGHALPLTPAQKFNLVYHSSIDPFTIGTAFVLGGYDEISGAHKGYGWGPGGYFDRVGAQYGDTVNGAIIGNAILPILLHQDPRYFRKGTGTVKSRILYSALSTVICRGDNGHNQFNVSNVAGNFISGAISNAYYPADERGVGLTLDNGLTVTAEGAIAAQLLEFSPDLLALYHRHKANKAAQKAAAAHPTAQPAPPTTP